MLFRIGNFDVTPAAIAMFGPGPGGTGLGVHLLATTCPFIELKAGPLAAVRKQYVAWRQTQVQATATPGTTPKTTKKPKARRTQTLNAGATT